MNISDEAVEAAAPWITNFLERRGLVLRGKEAQALAGYVLTAAAPHLMAKTEWGIFRASDPSHSTPCDNLTYKTREGAELARTTQFLAPEFWEVRGRAVGAWDRSAGAGE